MPGRPTVHIPADLRACLETARLDLLALFRALDRMDLAPAEIPQRLMRQIFELDADFAEALWALANRRNPWITDSCYAIRWLLWNSSQKSPADSGRTSLPELIPHWHS
jgi:hypothetical protein